MLTDASNPKFLLTPSLAPQDNLPQFEACPSSPDGESVCNSVLDLERGTFTASCDVVPCAGSYVAPSLLSTVLTDAVDPCSDCPTTVVNTVVVDEADCLYQGKGLVGFSSYAGESKCSCSSSVDSVRPPPLPPHRRSFRQENNNSIPIAIAFDATRTWYF